MKTCFSCGLTIFRESYNHVVFCRLGGRKQRITPLDKASMPSALSAKDGRRGHAAPAKFVTLLP
jgi:hypothetical protein